MWSQIHEYSNILDTRELAKTKVGGGGMASFGLHKSLVFSLLAFVLRQSQP